MSSCYATPKGAATGALVIGWHEAKAATRRLNNFQNIIWDPWNIQTPTRICLPDIISYSRLSWSFTVCFPSLADYLAGVRARPKVNLKEVSGIDPGNLCGLGKQSSRAPFCSQRAVEGLASQHLPVDSKVTNHTMTAVCLTASYSLPLPVQLSTASLKCITQWQKRGARLIPTAWSSPDRLPSVFTLNTYIWSYWLDFEDHFWHDLLKQWYLNASGSRTCSSAVTQALLKMVLDLEEGMSNLLS